MLGHLTRYRKTLIFQQADTNSKLVGLAKTQVMVPLYQAGIQLVKQGLTSFTELIRVTNKIITEEK